MNSSLPLHLRDLEQRVAVLQLSIQGLRATYGADPAVRADCDAVWLDAVKLRSHLEGVRIECEYAEARS